MPPPRHCERSEAIHLTAHAIANGLLRRFAPLRKRFAFVAGNNAEERGPGGLSRKRNPPLRPRANRYCARGCGDI